MDTKTGRIYEPEETKDLPEHTLKDLEPLTRDEAAHLANLPPTERKAALERYRALKAEMGFDPNTGFG